MASAHDPVPFGAELRRDGALALVRFSGELDLAGEEKARAAVNAALAQRVEVVLVDLRGLSYMDSTGLKCLIEAQARAHELNVRLAILNGSGAPHRVLEISGMADVFEMIESVSQLRLHN